jgi:hypothetical protein
MSENQFTEKERACVNCRHFRRRWTLPVLLDFIFDDGSDHYRCTRGGRHEKLNRITGKVTVTTRDWSCYYMRREHCGDRGQYWEPSEQFAQRKENLFKVINHVGDTGSK